MLNRRELRGFATAPFPLGAPFVLFAIPSGLSGIGTIVLLDYGLTIGLGLPIHLLLRWIGRRDLLSYLIAAFAAGLALGFALVTMTERIFPPDPRNPFVIHLHWQVAPIVAGLSLIPALLFWLVAVRSPGVSTAVEAAT